MTRPVDDDAKTTTVLDRISPTVVVRRRVYEPNAQPQATSSGVPRPLVHVGRSTTDDGEDESGPPSSVNVARALASLRGDELRRLEEIVSADDDPVASSAVFAQPAPSVRMPMVPPVPAVPTLRVGPTITMADLASGLGIPTQELVTALVTRGFFSVTVKTVLPRDTARMAATMFGWVVEDDDAIAESAVQSKPRKKPAPPPSSAQSLAGKLPKPGAGSAKKPAKRSVNRGR